MNSSRVNWLLVFTALIVLAAVYFKERSASRAERARLLDTVAELESQLHAQSQVLGDIKAKTERLEESLAWLEFSTRQTTGVSPDPAELQRTVATLPKPPEQTRQRAQAAMQELKLRYNENENAMRTALEKLERLRVELGVPDDVAVTDGDKAVLDFRLAGYRPYFEAKSEFITALRLSHLLKMKIPQGRIDAGLPLSE